MTITDDHTFVYPTARVIEVDDVIENIVHALEVRGWDIPGIDVEFSEFGSGEAKKRGVSYINGSDFKIHINSYASQSRAELLVIPGKELSLHGDFSGHLITYVGDDWERDKESFMSRFKHHAKLDNKPRTYLRYEFTCKSCVPRTPYNHHHRGVLNSHLVHNNDLRRDYDLEPGDVSEYIVSEVISEFANWFKDLLANIESHPETGKNETYFDEEVIPYPETIGPLFCFGGQRDAYRVIGGLDNPPEQRYALNGNGYRLLSLGIQAHDVPEIAYDGFLWCGVGAIDSSNTSALEVPGSIRWDRDMHVFRVTPNRANGIYIADHEMWDALRAEQASHKQRRELFTDEEINLAHAARARTIVPIHEYDGSFMQPVVLINRELELDEVEFVN